LFPHLSLLCCECAEMNIRVLIYLWDFDFSSFFFFLINNQKWDCWNISWLCLTFLLFSIVAIILYSYQQCARVLISLNPQQKLYFVIAVSYSHAYRCKLSHLWFWFIFLNY
jgi:hypothetical protein